MAASGGDPESEGVEVAVGLEEWEGDLEMVEEWEGEGETRGDGVVVEDAEVLPVEHGVEVEVREEVGVTEEVPLPPTPPPAPSPLGMAEEGEGLGEKVPEGLPVAQEVMVTRAVMGKERDTVEEMVMVREGEWVEEGVGV